MIRIPEFEFFEVDDVEKVFGSPASRYLAVSKDEAKSICAALPEEEKMASKLMFDGHLGEEQYGMDGRRYDVDATPEAIRKTCAALLGSFAVSHEVKIATMAVALHRWFPKTP